MDMYQWVKDLRTAQKKKPMPVLSFPGIQLLGCTVRELVQNGDLQAQCIQRIAGRYETAAALSNMDLSIEAEAFGAAVVFSDEEVPTVTGRLIEQPADILNVPIPPVGAGRTHQCLAAITAAARQITDRPVLAGIIGPYSLAGRLMDMTELMMQCMMDPDAVHLLLQKATEFLIRYTRALKEAGANGVIMAEPAAGLLSPAVCSEFSSTYVKTIIDAVEDRTFLVVYHNCGNTAHLADSIVATGAKLIHLGNAVQLEEVIEKYQSDKIILGNINPVAEFKNGTPESIARTTRTLLQNLSRYPNWIISSGCDIPPASPLANIDMFFKTVQDFYR